MTDKPRLYGMLIWTQWNGYLHPQLYRAHNGARPDLDTLAIRQKVAAHDLYEKDSPWTLDQAVQAHPAPALREEKA